VDATSEVSDCGDYSGYDGGSSASNESTTCWGREWEPLPWNGEREIFLCCTDQERVDQLRQEAVQHRQNSTIAAAEALAGTIASIATGNVGASIGFGAATVGPAVHAIKEGYEAGRKEREADKIERGEDPNAPYTPGILQRETWEKNYVERDNVAPSRDWTYNDRGGRDYDGVTYCDGVQVR
jgi:hypothetical protein